MDYENLTRRLLTLEGEKASVRRAVVMKLGCVLVANVEVPDDSLYPVSDRENVESRLKEQETPKQLSKEIYSALEKHPNIFDAVRFGRDEADLEVL